MPTVPNYFATEPMRVERLPRAPARELADVGQTLEAEAMAGFGGAILRGGQELAEIESDKQRGRNNATLAKLKGDMDDFEYAEETAIKSIKFNDLKEFGKLEESYDKRWDKKTQELLKGQNEQVKEYFQNHIQLRKDRSRRNYHSSVSPKEQSFGQGQGLSLYNKALRKGDLKGALFALNSHAQYIPPKELQALKDKAPHDIEWYAGEYLANNNPEALLANLGTKGFLENLNPSEKQRLKDEAKSKLATLERQKAAVLKEKQEQTANQFLLSLWKGELRSGDVAQALDVNLITGTRAKSLRKALLNPEMPETDLFTLVKVKDAILDIGLGVKTKDQALDVLYESVTKLAPAKAEQLLSDINKEHLKNEAYWQKESLKYIEKQILDVASMTGILYGSSEQQILVAEAKLAYDVALEEAARKDEPVVGRDKLILAHQIMLPFRSKVKSFLPQEKALPKTIGKGMEEKKKPTADKLINQARATTDMAERKRIYEQGKKLGYWK